MTPNYLDLSAIDPRNGAKYSPNLYGFLSSRKNRIIAKCARVYADTEGVLWVGYQDDDYLIGARLMHVLCEGSRARVFAYAHIGALSELEDFWMRYVADGRCAIDPDHKTYFIGDETRWSGGGTERCCIWCGKARQRLERWVERVERERWVTADAIADAGNV